MPDLREESPSKIAAGFGGTLSLVISAFYIIVIVLLTALPSHFYVAVRQADVRPLWVQAWLVAGTLAACLAGSDRHGRADADGTLRRFAALEF